MKKTRIDIVLQRCAWVTQILLFFAALAGYFLTVRPVYQKQLLDEQIAERTVRLREATITLDNLQKEETNLRSENAKLVKEAEVTYKHLRDNLFGQLISIPSLCIYRPATPLNGKELLDCVTKYTHDNITVFLKQHDQNKVNASLQSHSGEILQLPQRLKVTRAERLNNARTELARLNADIEKRQQDFIAEIRKLRVYDGDRGDNIHTLADIGKIRDGKETDLYLRFYREFIPVFLDQKSAMKEELIAKSDIDSELYEALDKIMEKITTNLQN